MTGQIAAVERAVLERAVAESPPKTRAIVMLEQARLHELEQRATRRAVARGSEWLRGSGSGLGLVSGLGSGLGSASGLGLETRHGTRRQVAARHSAHVRRGVSGGGACACVGACARACVLRDA